jgi:HK97 family phage prohead protease
LEKRNAQEFRADGEGIIEGYIVVWDTVDSYNSTFQPGAFKKTLQERGNKIKLLWNHEQTVIGKPLEIREDDKGVYFRGKLLTDSIEKAREVYELIRAEAINTMSFGFTTVKDVWERGVRVIKEVRLMEISPVIFEANENAVITGVRGAAEARATDFDESLYRQELSARGYRLQSALEVTLQDIWWENQNFTPEEVSEKFSSALGTFASEYMTWVSEVLDLRGKESDELRAEELSGANELARAFRAYLRDSKQTLEAVCADTSFTTKELRALSAGERIAAHDKLEQLPEEIRAAHQRSRGEAVDTLCSELRCGGLSPAEKERVGALLGFDTPGKDPEPWTKVVAHLTDFRKTLEKKHV